MTSSVPSRALEWTSLILGAGLFCAAFLFEDQPEAALSAAMTGLCIVTCSTLALNRYNSWTEWSNIAFASWAIIAPFMLGFGAEQSLLSIHLIVGLCVSTIATMQLIIGRQAVLAHAKVPKRK